MARKHNRESEGTSKRQELRSQRLQRQRRQRIAIFGGIFGVVLIVAGFLAWSNIQAANAPVAAVTTVPLQPRTQAQANNMGNPNAPVKMIIYSDFQCPYCKNFAQQTEKQIEDTYVKTGKVYLTYRSMGNWVSDNIGTGGSESRKSAEAAYCAGDQNKFWEFHDMLFANWLGEEAGSFTDKRLAAIAEKVGLNMTQFNACYSSQKYAGQVNQDNLDGIKAGVQGTPSFVINGKKVEGALPFSDFQKDIDAALAAAGQ